MKKYKLVNANGDIYESTEKGTLGGNKSTKIYGQLDCSIALNILEQGTYQKNRVFFKNEQDAIAAGYKACSHCMKDSKK